MNGRSKIEEWLKDSSGKFIRIYTSSPSRIRMSFVLFLLRMLFLGIALVSAALLIGSQFYNLGQMIRESISFIAIPKLEIGQLNLLYLIDGFLFLVSVFSLRLIKLLRIRNKHISEFYYFWDKHVETGRKLLQDN